MTASSVEFFEYRIKAGDSLSMIMAKFYGVGPRSPNYNAYLQQILSLNPPYQRPEPNSCRVPATLDSSP